MLYDKIPMRPSASKISKVVGYIVDYASKSTETEKQTKVNWNCWSMKKTRVQATHQMSEEWL